MITAEQLLDNTSHMDWLTYSQKMLVEVMMEAYKELALEEVKNNAHLHNVSNQRELLIDFFMKYLNDTAKYNESVEPSDIIDKYLKGNL